MKARQAKKILRGLSVARLRPGDVVVCSVPRAVLDDPSKEATIYDNLRTLFPGHMCVVKPADTSLHVVRPEKGAAP